jgi:hypothetical protein
VIVGMTGSGKTALGIDISVDEGSLLWLPTG